MFAGTDRAGRLMYVHDTAMMTKAGVELFSNTADFVTPVQNFLSFHKVTCPTWRELYKAGKLRVGFGPALDIDWRDAIFREAGREVTEEEEEELPKEEEVLDEDVEIVTVPKTEEKNIVGGLCVAETGAPQEPVEAGALAAREDEDQDGVAGEESRTNELEEFIASAERVKAEQTDGISTIEDVDVFPLGWALAPRSKYTDMLQLGDEASVLARRPGCVSDDQVLAISADPIPRFQAGYEEFLLGPLAMGPPQFLAGVLWSGGREEGDVVSSCHNINLLQGT